jgi:hypothetical protein
MTRSSIHRRTPFPHSCARSFCNVTAGLPHQRNARRDVILDDGPDFVLDLQVTDDLLHRRHFTELRRASALEIGFRRIEGVSFGVYQELTEKPELLFNFISVLSVVSC